MKKLAFTALCASLLCSCGVSPYGTVYTETTQPIAAGSGGGSKVGVSESATILGIVAIGDASIEAAKANGRISSVSTVDQKVSSILGIYSKFTTTVKGN
ncbi:MAG: TRL domain-containing protein [Rikenellaceae bacterium]